MKIKNIPSNYVMLLLLTVVFLTAQWSTSHVHTTEKHNHDGSQHQHQTAHTHSLIEQVTTADFPHQLNHENIVEFGNEYYLSQSEIKKTQLTFIVDSAPSLSPTLVLTNEQIPIFESSRSNYLDRSNIKLRAPPQIS